MALFQLYGPTPSNQTVRGYLFVLLAALWSTIFTLPSPSTTPGVGIRGLQYYYWIILGTASTSTCINISGLYPPLHYGAADTYLYSSIRVPCWQGAAKLPHDDNTYMGSYQNVFSQKVQSFAFTWGSASYCFHFQGPVQRCSICKRIVFLQGYLARGTFSRSRLARNWLLLFCCCGHAVRLVCARRI